MNQYDCSIRGFLFSGFNLSRSKVASLISGRPKNIVEKIISKTPLRISFVGGGTDLPSFYQKYGGAVISTAIDKYVTVAVSPRRDTKICVSSPVGKQTVTSVDQIDHPIVRESMCKSRIWDSDSIRTGVGWGINIDIASDVAPGSGLGCSSALTVGLLNALRAYYTEQSR